MEKFIEWVNKCYDKSPLYIYKKQLLGIGVFLQWEEIPVLEKDEVIIAGEDILPIQILPLLHQHKLMYFRTSGSTGKYIDIYWKREDFIRSMMPLWLYRMRYYGIRPGHKLCYFYTDFKDEAHQEYWQHQNQLGFCKRHLTEERLIEIYNMMYEFEPRWMILQPSMAVLLCECVVRNNLPKLSFLTYIEFTGEVLSENVRNRVKELFGCQVANQYGANEVNSIAYECPYGNMHIMDTNVYVEVLQDNQCVKEGEIGEICITTLTNSAMPLVRYKIGDIGTMQQVKCQCGNKGWVLTQLLGRNHQWIIDRNHHKVTSYILVRVFDTINKLFGDVIIQYQVEQIAYDTLVIRLCLENTGFSKMILERQIILLIDDEMGYQMKYRFKYQKNVFTERGDKKHSFFIGLMQ